MNSGIEAHAIYFDRDYYKGTPLPCKSQSVGRIQHGKYYKRILPFIKAFWTIHKVANECHIIYAFGLDMAILAIIATMNPSLKIVYEIGDIRKTQLSQSFIGFLVRLIEKRIIKRSDEMIVTASGYATEYYGQVIGIKPNKIRIIQNRLDLPIVSRPEPRFYTHSQTIVIGYFGVLRCKKSWTTLKELALIGNRKIKILIRGYPMGIPLTDELSSYPNIKFGGPYIAPDELCEMYSSVDIVWGCYSSNDTIILGNWKWARTNRFFESCFFKRPIISQYGTDEAAEVESLNIGMAVDLGNPKNAATEILDSLPNNLLHWQKNIAAIPTSSCVYTNEHKLLAKSLKAINYGIKP